MTGVSRRQVIGLTAGLLLVATRPALAGVPTFIGPDEVPLAELLTPPPADDSAATMAEIAAFHLFELKRTAEESSRAIADDEETLQRFFGGMGISLDVKSLPLADLLFQRLGNTTRRIVHPAKVAFNRHRPSLVDRTIVPLINVPRSGAYPSGHATFGALTGQVLARMLPEWASILKTRADEYGLSRYIAGVHFLTDIEAGKQAAALIETALLKNADFQQALSLATPELRKALRF